MYKNQVYFLVALEVNYYGALYEMWVVRVIRVIKVTRARVINEVS